MSSTTTTTTTTTTKKALLPVPEGSLSYTLTTPATPSTNALPTLLFVHAAVSTQSLWDRQVEYFSCLGYKCLTYDHFTWGGSLPSETYLDTPHEERGDYDPFQHLEALIATVLDEGEDVVLVGLSMGGGFVLEFALLGLDAVKERVVGGVVLAGGVDYTGFDHRGELRENSGEEVKMFEEVESLLEKGDMEGVARMWMRIWADGPLQEEGRFEDVVGEEGYQRMLGWNMEIAKGERQRRGLKSKEYEDLKGEKAIFGLERGEWKIPVALGYGNLDETETTGIMRFLGSVIRKEVVYGGEAKAFEAAHMINLEKPEEVNEWIEVFLRENGWC